MHVKTSAPARFAEATISEAMPFTSTNCVGASGGYDHFRTGMIFVGENESLIASLRIS